MATTLKQAPKRRHISAKAQRKAKTQSRNKAKSMPVSHGCSCCCSGE